MALTLSTMLPIGTIAPDFKLLDTISGETYTLDDLRSTKATVVLFICNHCPYVIHVLPELIRIAHDYIPLGVSFIAISSNDVVRYPADAPEKMTAFAAEHQLPFVYLYDESQSVARAYDAACTPDIYLFDADMKLVYRGRIDESRPNTDIPLSGKDLRTALDQVLVGEKVPDRQYPSAGCSIKWKVY